MQQQKVRAAVSEIKWKKPGETQQLNFRFAMNNANDTSHKKGYLFPMTVDGGVLTKASIREMLVQKFQDFFATHGSQIANGSAAVFEGIDIEYEDSRDVQSYDVDDLVMKYDTPYTPDIKKITITTKVFIFS